MSMETINDRLQIKHHNPDVVLAYFFVFCGLYQGLNHVPQHLWLAIILDHRPLGFCKIGF